MVRFSVLPFLLAGTAAAAQQAPQQEEIVVTGHGLQSALGERVYDVVAIDRDQLTGSASGRLDEILKQVPGYQLFRRSDSRSANPTSQGVTLRALGGNASSRALLILDGVPQTDPFGGWISWPAYDPERLGQVRVVRGGGSGAFGAGALAGTIELLSADPQQLRGLYASASYGSRDSVDLHANLGTPLGTGFVTVGGSYGRGDGFVPVVKEQRGPADRPSPYQQSSLSLRAIARLSSDVELQLSGLHFSDDRERGTAFSDISTEGTDASLRLVGSGRWHWSALGYVQTRQFYNSFASVNAARSAATRTSEQYNVPSTGLGGRFEIRPPIGRGVELRLGADWRQTEGETRERYSFVNGTGTRGRTAGGLTRTAGAFAEAALDSGDFTLSAGGRIDRWWIEDGHLQEHVLATGALLTDTPYRDRHGWQPTGRAGIAFHASDALTLRSAAYLGWRLPTLNELYRPFRVGADATAANADLDPERMQGFEAGIDLRPLPRARVGLTLFSNRLENAIANVTLGEGPGTFPQVGFVAAGGTFSQRQNVDAVEVRGLEVDARLDLGRWSVSGGYSYSDAEVRSSGAAAALDGLRPAQTPRHTLSGTLSWRGSGDIRASATARYTGSQFEDDRNTQRIPDALTFDASASLPLSKRLAVEARAENIGNERVVAGISGAGILERASPRTLWIGLRYRG